MPRVVIADTSPLRYLILIGEAELLPALYTEVLIPEAVANELSQPPRSRCVTGLSVDPSGFGLFP